MVQMSVAPTQAQLIEIFSTMNRIRAFDEKVDELFAAGKVYGTTHLYVGEEAVAAGVCAILEPADYITSTHRGHGHNIAKGGDLKRMAAELLGKEAGYCHGRGGSMHIADAAIGNLGANGIVGDGMPIAVGAALALSMQRRPQVVAAFAGDGSLNEGAFHEAVNLAAVWHLPVVFVIENNQYAMSTAVSRAYAIPELIERARAYGIPGIRCDGNDLLNVMETAGEAVARARAGGGPTMVEAVTYRWKGHSKSDAQRYRTRDEVAEWKKRDPVAALARILTAQGVAQDTLDALAAAARQDVEDAFAYAESAPLPDPAALEGAVYA